MRRFTYYLFENFDPDREAENPGNPRRVLTASANAPLSRVPRFHPPIHGAGYRRRKSAGSPRPGSISPDL